jgi:sterol 3beta-glucosyltransferase
MRILIAANDTRGGVQPYVALGIGLRHAGHDVGLLAPTDFAAMAADAGLVFHALSGSVEAAARELGSGMPRGGLAGMRMAAREMEGRTAGWTREARAAVEGYGLVLGGIGGMMVARTAAEAARIPFMEAQLQPVGAPTDRYPGALFANPPRWLGGLGRRLSHRATEMAVWMPFRGAVAKARRTELGLAGSLHLAGDGPVLYGFSRHVVPVPEDGPRRRVVTGWWFLDEEAWTPPAELERFLAGPEPVVSIGFGSMTGDDAAALTDLVAGAVRDAGVRAVLLSGWGGLAAVTHDRLHVARSIPHAWLFPRVAAVVHHGGAGTTGAGLRAGVPSIVVPFGVDQPFWGSRVLAVGAGPEPIARRSLTRERLAAALRQAVSDVPMREAAARIGAAIRAEDGVRAAVGAIEAAWGGG